MKAAMFNKYGGPEVIEIADVPKPTVASNQVLVEVHATSINPFDRKIRAGNLKETIPLQFPVTIGGDFAGIITEVGEEVRDYRVGDTVFGSALILNGGSGSFAEFATARRQNIAQKPKSVDFLSSAASVLVGASAVQALEDHIYLKEGQKILIHGGAGGIGSMAVQLAKSIGAYAATTVSPDDVAFVKQLGADEVIDYKNEKFEEKLKDFDAVFDTVGGDTTDRSFQVLKKGGIIVSMLGQPSEELAKKHEVTAIGQGTNTNTAHLTRLATLIDSGVVKPHIDKVFTLDQAREAFDYFETGHPKGKVVIKVKE